MTLNDKEQAYLQSFIRPLQSIQAQLNAAIGMLINCHGLEGRWILNEAGTELIKQQMPEQVTSPEIVVPNVPA